MNAIAYDIPGAEYTHEGNLCTFDFIPKKYNLTDTVLLKLAEIVRGIDTDRFDFAPQAAELWVISDGLSYNIEDDHEMLAVVGALVGAVVIIGLRSITDI